MATGFTKDGGITPPGWRYL